VHGEVIDGLEFENLTLGFGKLAPSGTQAVVSWDMKNCGESMTAKGM